MRPPAPRPPRRAPRPAPPALLPPLATGVALAVAIVAAAPSRVGAQTAQEVAHCEHAVDRRLAEARARLQQLAEGGTPSASFAAGCLALADGRAADAERHFRRLVEGGSPGASAHYWLGRAYGEQAQRANPLRQASLARRTKGEFERAVQLDPDYVDAREGLMQFYLRAPGVMGGSEAKAREQAQEIARRNRYRGGLALAVVSTRRKDLAGAAREYEQLAAQFPDSSAPWTQLAALHAQQRQWDQAFATIERMQRAQPASMPAQYALGRLAAESGMQLERGEQALRRYLTHQPRPNEPPLANAHWRLGAILERQGRPELARAEYRTAVRLDPALRPAREALAKLE